ncbi:MAG: EAL domain-containing protein [Clostridia bacterium]|nr:EAL domain-containing protein [Clostridia bacterium]
MRKNKRAIINLILSLIMLIIFYVGLMVVTEIGVNKVEEYIKNDRIDTLNNFSDILNSTLNLKEEDIYNIKNNTTSSIELEDIIVKKINEVETFDFFEEDIINVSIYDNSIDKNLIFISGKEVDIDINEILDDSTENLYDTCFVSYKDVKNANGDTIAYVVSFANRKNYDVWVKRGTILSKILLGIFAVLLVYSFLANVLKLNRLQYRDQMTGLVSKKYYKRLILRLIDRAPRANGNLFVIGFRDLFDFEAPNTELLEDIVIEFASILKKYKNKNSVAFRVSERKLGLYVHNVSSTDHTLEKLLGDVEQLLRSKRQYQNIQYYLGVAYYPLHEKDVDALVNGAIYALETLRKGKKQYHIKNYQVYDPSSRKEYVDRQYLYDEVEKIINERRVYSVFQAIVDVKTGKIMGYEALSRPISELVPNIGMLISLASEMGISEDLELLLLYIINKTVTDLKEQLQDKNLFINTNVSVKYGDKELNKFKTTIDKITNNLVVEITEYDEIDFETITDKINKIKEFGAQIAIDDFGSGYSNELALLSLKPDIVKIDMALIRNIDQDQRKHQIVSNLINYAKNNDIKTLAEGVETPSELKAVKELGADYIQGFIFSKPDKNLLFKDFDIDEYINRKV